MVDVVCPVFDIRPFFFDLKWHQINKGAAFFVTDFTKYTFKVCINWSLLCKKGICRYISNSIACLLEYFIKLLDQMLCRRKRDNCLKVLFQNIYVFAYEIFSLAILHFSESFQIFTMSVSTSKIVYRGTLNLVARHILYYWC